MCVFASAGERGRHGLRAIVPLGGPSRDRHDALGQDADDGAGKSDTGAGGATVTPPGSATIGVTRSGEDHITQPTSQAGLL